VLLLYHLAWTFLVVLLLPFIPLLKYHRLVQRLAVDLPARDAGDRTIWIHALSVGEVLSALPLVRSLKEKLPQYKIAFTVTTRQGMEIACKELEQEVEVLFPMPLDFWWSMLRVIHYVRPKLFILVETDLWPGLIAHLAGRGITMVLVNGRVSLRTMRSYRRFRFFIRRMLGRFNLCLMQTNLDRTRLLDIGIGEEKVKALGNIKFDQHGRAMEEKEGGRWRTEFNLSPEDTVWLAGSTHAGEEDIILDTFKEIRSSFSRLRLIIAPRRLERVQEVHRLAEAKGLKALMRTCMTPQAKPWEVLILDTIGELASVYSLASISFVGGSLVPEGGHNLLEPASFGCPVLFGPHTEDFKTMAELLLEAGGGIRVHDARHLSSAVQDLLSSPKDRKAMGTRAGQFVEHNRGALERVMTEISRLIGEPLRTSGLH
jgi:3-deoxy-D-manno-octulosonic-acid transferase